MHTKAGSFQGFTPILSAAQLCKYARKVLTDMLIVVSLHCAFLHCWQEGEERKEGNLRIATPWSDGKWREESVCPLLWKLGPAYFHLCFLLPGWETKGPSSSQIASKISVLSHGSYRHGIWQHCSILGEWMKGNRKLEGGAWKNLYWKFSWSLSVVSFDLCLNS